MRVMSPSSSNGGGAFSYKAKLKEVKRTLLGGSPLACRARDLTRATTLRTQVVAQQAAPGPCLKDAFVLNEASRPEISEESQDMFTFDQVV